MFCIQSPDFSHVTCDASTVDAVEVFVMWGSLGIRIKEQFNLDYLANGCLL